MTMQGPLDALVDVVRESPWRWASPAWIGAATWIAAWWMLERRMDPTGGNGAPGRARRAACAGLAALLFILAFVSPLATLADGVVFSAHMAQHLVLLLVVPLLAVMALPPVAIESLAARAPWRPVAAVLAIAPLGWLLGLGAMWAWHEPAACGAAAAIPALGRVRDATFLAAGVAFWWPVAGPIGRDRLSPPMAMAYLVSACLGCTALGILLTFTPVTMCPSFAAQSESALLARLRAVGFTAAVDQQLGGLLMWVPPCLLYAIMSMRAVARWQRGEGCSSQAPAPRGDRSIANRPGTHRETSA